MASSGPSLITGLDPAGLLALAAATGREEPPHWEAPGLDEVAKLFPAWQVRGLLGRGGMGAVYLMHQPELDRDVAVKLLPIEASRDEHQVERFRREARALARLRHPGIVALYEAGITPAGHLFFVMEHVDGCPLTHLIADGKLDVPKAIEVVRQVCDALACAHAAGIVHRDIKPSNILIDREGKARVADFGLARWDQPAASGALDLSRTGVFMGTPAYTAPEQARGAAHADHRADIFSLGVLLYEMLTGELPRGVFQPPSRKAGSAARLDEVVQRALQERPEDRYQAADELKKDVSEVQSAAAKQMPPTKSAAWLPWTMVGVASILIAAFAIVAQMNRAGAPATPAAAPAQSPALPHSSVSVSPNGSEVQTHPKPEPSPSVFVQPAALTAAAPPHPAAASLPPANSSTPPRVSDSKVPSIPPPTATAGPAPVPVKVWSIEPIPPSLQPPTSLMRQRWTDAALVRRGGAALLADGRVFGWSDSAPDSAHQASATEAFTMLACTPEEVVALDRGGRLLRLVRDPNGSTSVIATNVRVVFPSAHHGWIAGILVSGTAMVWPLNTEGKGEPLPVNLGAITQVTLTADGAVWAVNTDKVLLRMDSSHGAAFAATQHRGVKRIAAGGNVLAALTENGLVIAAGEVDGAPSGGGTIADVMGGDGFIIAIETSGRAILWGDAVPDSPQRFRLPAGTERFRCGPQGLFAAW